MLRDGGSIRKSLLCNIENKDSSKDHIVNHVSIDPETFTSSEYQDSRQSGYGSNNRESLHKICLE